MCDNDISNALDDVWDGASDGLTLAATTAGLKEVGDFVTTGDITKFTDIWGYAWDKVFNPVLEPIFGLLGFKDYDVVAGMQQAVPLYMDETAFTYNNDVVIKAAVLEADTIDLFKSFVYQNGSSRFKSGWKYAAAGDAIDYVAGSGYYAGLPSIQYSAITIPIFNTVLLEVYEAFCNANGFPYAEADVALLGVKLYEYGYPSAAYVAQHFLSSVYSYNNVTSESYIPNFPYTVSLDYAGNSYNSNSGYITLFFRKKEVITTLSSNPNSVDVSMPDVPHVVTPQYSNGRQLIDVYVDVTTTVSTTTVKGTTVNSNTVTLVVHIDSPNNEYSTSSTVVNGDTTITTTVNAVQRADITYYWELLYTYSTEHYYSLYNIELAYLIVSSNNASLNTHLGITPDRYIPMDKPLSSFVKPITEDNFDTLNVEDLMFFPAVPIKQLGSWVNADKESNEYKTTNTLLKKFKLDVDYICEITKQANQDNDSNVQSAGVIFGVNPTTTNKASKKYLYTFFDEFKKVSSYGAGDIEGSDSGESISKGFNALSLAEGTINQSIQYDYIEKVTGVTRTGKQGTYEIVVSTGTKSIATEYSDDSGDEKTTYTSIEVQVLNLYKFTAENIADELTVFNISNLAVIQIDTASHAALSTPKLDSGNVTIPLILGILDKLTLAEASEVVARSPHLVIFAGEVQHLEWYQNPTFIRLVGFVIQIVVSIYTGPKGAAAVDVLIQMLIQVAIAMSVNFLIMKLMEWFPDEEWVQILGAVVIVTVAVLLQRPEGLSNAATAALMVSNTATAYNAMTNYQLEKIAEEIADVNQEARELLEANEEKYGYLFDIDIISEYKKEALRVETPDMFFNRALNPTLGTSVIDSALVLVNDNSYLNELYT